MRIQTVSFICVLYNHENWLVQRCIDSIHEVMKNITWFTYDIILVNNNCWKDYQLKGKIKLIDSPTNLGYCGGNNKAITISSSDYMIVINPDIQLINHLGIERMINACITNDTIAGRLVGNEKWYTYPASFPTDRKYLNNDLPFFYYEHTLDKPGNWKPFQYIDGSLMAFSKSLWKKIGRFDEDFFPGYFGENVFAFKAFCEYEKSMLEGCNLEGTYIHDNNNTRLDSSSLETITKNMRLLFYYKYALNSWELFLCYLNQ